MKGDLGQHLRYFEYYFNILEIDQATNNLFLAGTEAIAPIDAARTARYNVKRLLQYSQCQFGRHKPECAGLR